MSYVAERYCFHFSVWGNEAVFGIALFELVNSCHRFIYFGYYAKVW